MNTERGGMNTNSELNINIIEKLERLVQPYSADSKEIMKQELLAHPEMRLIHVWNGSHLSDRESYEICRKEGISVSIEKMEFSSINEAAIYVCGNQMKRSDLSVEYKKYLIGQRCFYEQAIRADTESSESKYAIASVLASELYISAGTVRKYFQYAMAIDAVFDQDDGFAKKLLSGNIKISHENAIELSRLKPEELSAIARSSAEEMVDHITLSYIRNEVKWSHIQPRNSITRKEYSGVKEKHKASIRQMPEYDPDAEANSLCMTIDSWISSIKRVNNSENFPKITHIASLRLMKKLSLLENTINSIQDSLVERTGV